MNSTGDLPLHILLKDYKNNYEFIILIIKKKWDDVFLALK